MSDDSFDFKSFTVDIILNSLEKIFRSLTLIDINVTDMTFIDEFLMSELCERFDIQSISLSKSKLIRFYDEMLD
jgi:spore cortex formation protein SpoVR/YcgB (stage V sporulation)